MTANDNTRGQTRSAEQSMPTRKNALFALFALFAVELRAAKKACDVIIARARDGLVSS